MSSKLKLQIHLYYWSNLPLFISFPKWSAVCAFWFPFCEKDRWQTGHTNGFSPVCTLLCILKASGPAKLFWHTGQTYRPENHTNMMSQAYVIISVNTFFKNQFWIFLYQNSTKNCMICRIMFFKSLYAFLRSMKALI